MINKELTAREKALDDRIRPYKHYIKENLKTFEDLELLAKHVKERCLLSKYQRNIGSF